MHLDEETYDRLISQIFSAALDSSQWHGFLGSLAAVSGGVRTHIIGHDLRRGQTLPAAYAGYGSEYIEAWDAYYSMRNAWAPGFGAAPVGKTIPAEQMCAPDALKRTEFYHDWVRPQEDISSGGGVVLSKDDASFFALGGNIRARDLEKLQRPFLALVQRLTPHLQNALAISRRVGALAIEATVLSRARAGPGTAVLLLNAARAPVYANTAARQAIEAGTVLCSDYRGRVGFADAGDDRRLAAALAGLAKSGGALSQVFAPAGTRPAQLCRMARLDLPEMAQHPDFLLGGPLLEPCLLVTLGAPFSTATAIAVLKGEYRLTRAEAEIAAGMARGEGLRALAEARGTSLHTVRNQLKAVLSKTGRHSQRDLVRLVVLLGS